MNILIISGFLGAGKTTFIKTMSRKTGREFAILENEYGSAGMDGDNLRSSMANGKVNIWEMTEGCICCSMKGDFAASVLTIANSVDPEYLVIEPTGVGMLSNIIGNLQQIEYERISLLAPAAVVDGQSFAHYSRDYPDIYRDQIASASTVIVSKMEYASSKELNTLESKLKEWNPDGEIVMEHYSTKEPDWWNRLLEKGRDGSLIKQRSEGPSRMPDAFSLDNVSMESPAHLFFLLEGIIHEEFGSVFRAKGCVNAGEQRFFFDVADGRYTVTGASDEQNKKAVFIGENIRRQCIRRYFSHSEDNIKKSRRIKYTSVK